MGKTTFYYFDCLIFDNQSTFLNKQFEVILQGRDKVIGKLQLLYAVLSFRVV